MQVVDFGCADMRLLSLLRRTEGIEHILEVSHLYKVMKENCDLNQMYINICQYCSASIKENNLGIWFRGRRPEHNIKIFF